MAHQPKKPLPIQPPPPKKALASRSKPVKRKKKAVDPSIDPSTDRSTDPSIDPLTAIDTFGPVVGKPRAFYITHKVDRWLDEAVNHFKDKGIHKVDRSVIVNALLHDPRHFKPGALGGLRKRVLAHLTNKSLKRVESTH